MPQVKNIEYNNPFTLNNKRAKELETIRIKLLELVEEFAKKEALSQNERQELINIILTSIEKRKMKYWIDNRCTIFNNHLNTLTNLTLENGSVVQASNDLYKKDLFYIKNTKHTVAYE